MEGIKIRKEGQEFLIGNGGGFVVGNVDLINFIKNINGSFRVERISEEFGQLGVNLITYLYNKGLVNDEI